MKTKIVLLFLSTCFIAGCKYEDGPGISFRSACARVTGEWVIESLTVDGADSLPNFNNRFGNCSVYEFMDTGSEYLLRGFPCDSIFDDHGHWQLGEDNTSLYFTLGNPYGPVGRADWQIIRLANDEMWLRTEYFNYKMYEIHFKTK